MKTINPLRYPGAKSSLIEYISEIIKSNDLKGCTFYEPYAGSAAVSLGMLQNDLINKAILVEKDPLLYAFWKSVFENTDNLCTKIESINITVDTWLEMSKYKDVKDASSCSLLQLGLAGLFLNRTNFSGILGARPIGGYDQKSQYKIDCRFNKERIIDIIYKISRFKDQIEIHNDDALVFMQNNIKWRPNNKCFVYIDPPYYEQGKNLYRFFYTDEDHICLANYVKSHSFPWLLSYDDHPFINNLYFGDNGNLCKQNLYIDYSVKKSKKGKEILISNLAIPPVVGNINIISKEHNA